LNVQVSANNHTKCILSSNFDALLGSVLPADFNRLVVAKSIYFSPGVTNLFDVMSYCPLTLWEPGYDTFVLWFQPTTAVFGYLTNALAPPSIALESCSRAQTDRPVK